MESEKENLQKLKVRALTNELKESQRDTVQLFSERGTSSWLDTLTLNPHSFNPTKSEFGHGLLLMHSWESETIPSKMSYRDASLQPIPRFV